MKPRPRIAGVLAIVTAALGVVLVIMYAVDGRWGYSLFFLFSACVFAVLAGVNLRAARGAR
jgi:hypothetical protein